MAAAKFRTEAASGARLPGESAPSDMAVHTKRVTMSVAV